MTIGSRAAITLLLAVSVGAQDRDHPTTAEVRGALHRASEFFASIATHGGWVGIYSEDLSERYGEATYQRAKDTEIWIQPPGTPTVGDALLRAHQVTGEARYLELARQAGLALAWGQRENGGWPYLADLAHVELPVDEPERRPGRATFDDDTTQAPLRFLLRLDQRIDEAWLDAAIERGLDCFADAQFENGAWPQRHPSGGGYGDFFTFNDGVINTCISTLLLAHDLRGDERSRELAVRGGEFVLLSQIDPPQPGWAQQYSHDLEPAWARAFEPPGVCSAVTRRNLDTLMELWHATEDERFLAPIPAAVEWLERSTLEPGLWARLYELGTNRPIYGDRDRKVHYTLAEISEERRNGYSWQAAYGIPRTLAAWRALEASPRRRPTQTPGPSAADLATLARRAQRAIDTLDEHGRWLRDGHVESSLFVRNATALCDVLAAHR